MKFSDIVPFTRAGSYEIDMPLTYLKKTLDGYKEEYNLELNPDFQRGNVWTEKQQIDFLEFFFRGGKTARVLYFNCPDFGNRAADSDMPNMVLVDGLQRITAFLRFMNNEIPIFGTFYKDFEDRMSATKFCVRININDLQYRKDVLRWYLDMNTGGVVHSDAEIQRVTELWKKEVERS